MLAEMAKDFATPPPRPPWFEGGGASNSSKRFVPRGHGYDGHEETSMHVSSVKVFESTRYC